MLGKPKNNNTNNTQEVKRSGRVRLTWLNSAPNINDVRLLMSEACTNKGSLCELPIRSANGTFLLSCQSDHLSPDPCWTLYEGEDGSKQLWSYMDSNLDMITDVVCMSVSQGAASGVDLSGLAPSPAPAQAPEPAAAPAPEAAWGSANGGGNAWPQTPADPAAWAQPAQAGWGNAAAPGATSWPDPMATNNWNNTASPFPTQQPAQGWPAAAQPAPVPSPAPMPAPQDAYNPYGSMQNNEPYNPYANMNQSYAQPNAPAYGNSSSTAAEFIAYLDKNPKMTIAEIAFAPNLPPNCVDAAMRLQEMFLKGTFDENVARHAIRICAEKNGVLDDSVIAQAKAKASDNPDEFARKAAAILQNAGLLTEADLAAAESKFNKGGTAYGDALIATGKIDQLLLDNAKQCHSYVSDGRIRADQAIIALHYCQRMRSKLDDALSDLSIDVV